MTIGIQCTHCQKRYNAPASMAGKRVKCKDCGKVFAIPSDSAESLDVQNAVITAPALGAAMNFGADSSNDLDDDAASEAAATPSARQTSGVPASAIRAIGTGAGQLKSPPVEGEEPPVKLGDPRHGIAKKLKRSDDVSEVEIAGEEPARIISLRPSVPFDFPGAAALDQFMPPTLLVLGLAWLAYMASGAHPDNIPWPGMLKVGLYLGLFLIVGFPMGYLALKWAARTRRFAMPPLAPWRALGAFALPFSLAMIMWLVGESLPMLIIGTLLGAAIACAAVWFLFRIQPQEVTTAIAATVAGLSLSIAISYGLLLVINLIMAASARSSGNNELSASPVGPTFAWYDPATSAPADKLRRQVAKANANPTTAITTSVPTTPESAGQEPKNTPPLTVIPGTDPPTPGTAITPAGTLPTVDRTGPAGTSPGTIGTPNPSTSGLPATTDGMPKPPPSNSGAGTTPPAAPGDPTPPVATKVTEPASPLVASITPVEVGPFDSLLFPPTGGQAVAVVRSVGDVDQIDLWGLHPPVRKGKATLRREKGSAGRYVLSSTGDLLAQLVAWPKLQASIWSFQAEKVVKSVSLNADLGTAELRGFAVADSLVVQWLNKENNPDMEVFSTRDASARRITYFPVDPFEAVSGNPSFSPDGRTMALATEVDKAGGIDLFDLTTQRRRIQRLKMPLTKWVKPTGMAFSPDNRQIAAFIENNGRGLITIHNLTQAGKLIHEHAYTDSPSPTGAASDLAIGGRTLDWLDSQTLLLYGAVLIDADSGQTLGHLGLPHARTQSIIDKQTILLHIKDGSEERMLIIKLNPDELDKARKAARGNAKPK